MKWILILLLVSQNLWAVRIIDGGWQAEKKEFVLRLSYQGSTPNHPFTIEWLGCEFDESEQLWFNFGQLVDGLASEVAVQNFELDWAGKEAADLKCESDVIMIKATSSPIPFLIFK